MKLPPPGERPLHDRCGEETDHAMPWRRTIPVIDAGVEQVIGIGRALDSAPRYPGINSSLRRRITCTRLVRCHCEPIAFAYLAHPGRIDRSAIMATTAA